MTDRKRTLRTADSSHGEADPQETPLDQRRDKLQKARATAESASAEVEDLDRRLETNAAVRKAGETDLRRAMDRVAAAKKADKAHAKDDDKLRTARKDAGQVADHAQHKAETAEAKYDRAVLADLVRREKDHDLSAHSHDGVDDTAGGGGDRSDSDRTSNRADTTRHTPTTTRPRSEAAADDSGV